MTSVLYNTGSIRQLRVGGSQRTSTTSSYHRPTLDRPYPCPYNDLMSSSHFTSGIRDPLLSPSTAFGLRVGVDPKTNVLGRQPTRTTEGSPYPTDPLTSSHPISGTLLSRGRLLRPLREKESLSRDRLLLSPTHPQLPRKRQES